MPNDNRHYHFIGTVDGAPDTKIFVRGKLKIIVGQEPVFGPGTKVWHLAISHPKRQPTWDELKMARGDLTPPEIVMILLFPAKENANVDPFTFHLYEYLQDPRLVVPTQP